MVGESTPNLGLYVKGEKGPPRGLGAKYGDYFEDFVSLIVLGQQFKLDKKKKFYLKNE